MNYKAIWCESAWYDYEYFAQGIYIDLQNGKFSYKYICSCIPEEPSEGLLDFTVLGNTYKIITESKSNRYALYKKV